MTWLTHILIAIALLPAEDMKGIHAGFYHQIIEQNSVDSARGEIFIAFPSLVHIHITSPVNQIMRLTSDQMIIYYPDSREGFVYNNASPLNTTWLMTIGTGKAESIFEGMKLKLLTHYSRGDSEIWMWERPRNKKSPLLRIKMLKINDLLRTIIFFNENGETLAVNRYNNYEMIADTFYLPTHIESITHTQQGTSREIVDLTDPEALPVLPQNVIDFTIPPDARVKTYE